MHKEILSIDLTSDGILVQFDDNVHCYYPAHFLRQHRNTGSNHVFLDYDPSPGARITEVPAVDGVRRASVPERMAS